MSSLQPQKSSLRRSVSALGAALLLLGCGYRPARFGAAPPLIVVADEQPIPRPDRSIFIPEFYEASVYVGRELTKALDPRHAVEALDVNAVDEVPASSWFRHAAFIDKPLLGYRRVGPPSLPWRVTSEVAASETPDAQVVIDARGTRYEVVADDPKRPGMQSGASAAASRILYALGYHTAEVHVVTTPSGERFTATRWPSEEDLGPTAKSGVREDDPNDRFDHRDRRSLRGLKLAAAWLDLATLPPRVFRDVYVGRPNQGHVEHRLVGIDGALGVRHYEDDVAWLKDANRESSNFFLRVFSLGLSPKPAAFAPEPLLPGLGLYEPFVVAENFSLSPPFAPADRMRAGDAYWMAKRIASIPERVLGRAVLSSKLPPLSQHTLMQLLLLRRAQVVAWGYGLVSPLEPGLVSPPNPKTGAPARLQFVDLAVASRMADRRLSSYQVRFLDGENRPIGPSVILTSSTAVVKVELPANSVLADYVVVAVTARRAGRALPFAVQLHLRRRQGALVLVGVQHD